MPPVLLGAGGAVLAGAPALAGQGEPAFAQAAQGPLDGVSRSAPGSRTGYHAAGARRPATLRRTGPVPRGPQGGTIGDHVEPSVEGVLWRDLLLLGLHAHVPTARFLPRV